MNEKNILPCPFCGGEGVPVYAYHDYNRWGVACRKCGASVEVEEYKGVKDTEENAILAWNRRV